MITSKVREWTRLKAINEAAVKLHAQRVTGDRPRRHERLFRVEPQPTGTKERSRLFFRSSPSRPDDQRSSMLSPCRPEVSRPIGTLSEDSLRNLIAEQMAHSCCHPC